MRRSRAHCGVSLAVVGMLVTVCWTVLQQPNIAWTGWLIAAAACALPPLAACH